MPSSDKDEPPISFATKNQAKDRKRRGGFLLRDMIVIFRSVKCVVSLVVRACLLYSVGSAVRLGRRIEVFSVPIYFHWESQAHVWLVCSKPPVKWRSEILCTMLSLLSCCPPPQKKRQNKKIFHWGCFVTLWTETSGVWSQKKKKKSVNKWTVVLMLK